jgi:glycosyltransferase involved in cell wall biosynthesis
VKVLILHQHFNSPETGGPLRSWFLSKALVEKGIDVAVITGSHHPKYSVRNVDGIEVHYLPVSYENRFGFYKRGLSFARYALDAVKVARQIKGISLCYAISVPLTVGQSAIWIERKLGIPFIFEIGDLWPDAPIELGFVRNPILKRSLYWLEQRIYKKASQLVVLSEPIRETIKGKVPEKDVSLIPNMSDTEFLIPAPKDQHLQSKYNTTGQFVVSYIGALGFANGLDFMMECARASKKAALPVRFLICGEGAMKVHLESVKATLQLDNVTLLPFTNRQGVKDVLNVTDAAFICYKPFRILQTGSPHKYFDGLAAGKLIIVNFEGWIKNEIESRKCGIYVDSKNPGDFVARIGPFVSERGLLDQYQIAARQLAEEKYSRAELTKRFVSLISKR